MSDVFSTKKRSEVMSRIRGRDTRPELAVRSMLHEMGFRFRLSSSDLAGRPDIVLPRYRTVIFVHGCFWHRHKGCRFAYTPKTRQHFWLRKFESNVTRDRLVGARLRRSGWKVITVWECRLRRPAALSRRLETELRKRLDVRESV